MLNPKSSSLFVLRAALVFGLLVLPCLGFRNSFAEFLQCELRLVFKALLPRHIVQVGRHEDPRHKSIDTEICVVNPEYRRADGLVPVKVATFDSRSLGWLPHAMILALCAATPLAWKQRWRVMAAGLFSTHLLVLATFAAGVLSGLAAEFPATWLTWAAVSADHVLVQNLWVSFVGPFLFWVICLSLFGVGTIEQHEILLFRPERSRAKSDEAKDRRQRVPGL